MNQRNKNKGITLIALVITIIILLILAGVTVGQLTENGLFDKVKLAKEQSDQAQAQENETLREYEDMVGKYINATRDDSVTSGYSEETGFYYQIFQNKFCILYQNYEATDTISEAILNFPYEFINSPTCQLTKTSATPSINNMVIQTISTKNVLVDTNFGYNDKCSFTITVFGIIK